MNMHQIRTFNKARKQIINWQDWIADFMHLQSKESYILKFKNGLKINVRTNTWDKNAVAEVIINNGYNPEGFEIKKGQSVIDVGGHIGCFSLLASLRTEKVYVFEPELYNFRCLTYNIKLNKKENIMPYLTAVARYKTVMFLNICKIHNGSHSFYNPSYLKDNKKTEKVMSINLNEFLEKLKLNNVFLKLDCEGAEWNIIESLTPGNLERIDKIVMEWHEWMHKDINIIKDKLEKNGFEVQVRDSLLFAKK